MSESMIERLRVKILDTVVILSYNRVVSHEKGVPEASAPRER